MKGISSQYKPKIKIYSNSKNDYEIIMQKEVVNDLVSKKAFNVFTFKLYKSGVFVCLTNIAHDPHEKVDIESFYPDVIKQLIP